MKVIRIMSFVALVAGGCVPQTRSDGSGGSPFDIGTSSETGDAATEGPGDGDPTPAADTTSTSEPPQGPVLDVGADDPTGSDGVCGCGDADEGVYLLGADASLWRFDPPALAFTPLGAFECPTQGQINSMAVDRSGRAWVNYVDIDLSNLFDPSVTGELFVVDLANPDACVASDYAPPEYHFVQVGMAFVGDPAASSCDELFLYEATDSGSGALGRVDLQTSSVAELGEVEYPRAELTGTADGRLYAFVDDGAARLVRYDTDDASELESIPLPGLVTSNGFSFAFWGGDVWFFTEANEGAGHSRVTRFDLDGTDDGGLEVVVDHAPGYFIGAGVSTCAPIEPVG